MKEPYLTITYLASLALIGIAINVYKNRDSLPLYRQLIVGHLMVNLPAFLLAFGLPIVMLLLFETWALRIPFMLFGFVTGLILAWINWSLLIPKWKRWAFRDLDEKDLLKLEKLAVNQRLIWQQGDMFEQTEIRSKKDKELLLNIEERINFLKEVEDIKLDLGLDRERTYKYNRSQMWLELISKLFLIVVIIGCLITGNYIIGLVLFIAVVLVGDQNELYNNLTRKPSSLTLYDRGIQIQTSKSYSFNWGEIFSITVDQESQELTLKLVNEKKPVTFKLAQFEIRDYEEFMGTISIYLTRYCAMHDSLIRGLN